MSDDAIEAQHIEIPDIVIRCQTQFAKLATNQTCVRQPWFRSAQGDFNLWCSGIKASGHDKSSLTYRLRKEKWKSVRDDIHDLLRGLCGILVQCQQLNSGKRQIIQPACNTPPEFIC